ncbi:hypothetical protein E2C01_083847 [Portunus trituberculatus]|uniref:Uncharacterized protein n=1 Tax=Portunus trituberculatus TaxID=210409 RepID=A0A5B7J3A6_PORTR|nr:hypothetical protein [Portunus trituberculatus]
MKFIHAVMVCRSNSNSDSISSDNSCGISDSTITHHNSLLR